MAAFSAGIGKSLPSASSTSTGQVINSGPLSRTVILVCDMDEIFRGEKTSGRRGTFPGILARIRSSTTRLDEPAGCCEAVGNELLVVSCQLSVAGFQLHILECSLGVAWSWTMP